MANSSGDPLFPLKDLKAPSIVVYGPGDEELNLFDPRAEDIGIKTCTHCGRVKLLTEFSPDQSWCKRCCTDRAMSEYLADPEPKKAAMRARYAAKADEINAATRQKRKEEPDRFWAHDLKKFHLTPDQYDEMFKRQNGVCAICEKPCKTRRRLAIDHDHSCCPRRDRSCGRCVRGLLCADCNNGLGRFGDDPELLRVAADYLDEWRKAHAARRVGD
jgi:hypothetical protein